MDEQTRLTETIDERIKAAKLERIFPDSVVPGRFYVGEKIGDYGYGMWSEDDFKRLNGGASGIY